MAKRRLFGFIVCVLVFSIGFSPAWGAPPSFSFLSGPEETFLLELYTSEGCSSCPPADRWFNGLKDEKSLWETIVPVTFHVDYWDYLGWKDPSASKEHTKRQRAYAAAWGSPTIYTPGFVFQGQEKRWGRPYWKDADRAQPGILRLEKNDQGVLVRFSSSDNKKLPLSLSVALLAMDFESDVRRGENRGRSLTHQFSVLQIKSATLKPNEEETVFQFSDEEWNRAQAIAGWVALKDSLFPIQATGGYLE